MQLDSISLTKSHIFWSQELPRKRLIDMMGAVPTSFAEWRKLVPVCPLCKGYGVTTHNDTMYHCFCAYLEKVEVAGIRGSRYESGWNQEASFAMLDPKRVKNESGSRDLAKAIRLLTEFEKKLDTWFFITGGPGTGKTTMLYAVKGYLGPMALYITMPDFQDTLFSLKDDAEALQEFMGALKAAPVLLLDDLGLEYGKSPWTTSMVANLVNQRYVFGTDLPTVVTSNLKTQDLIKSPDLHVRRIASRLVDGQHTIVVALRGEDYRVKTQQENA